MAGSGGKMSWRPSNLSMSCLETVTTNPGASASCWFWRSTWCMHSPCTLPGGGKRLVSTTFNYSERSRNRSQAGRQCPLLPCKCYIPQSLWAFWLSPLHLQLLVTFKKWWSLMGRGLLTELPLVHTYRHTSPCVHTYAHTSLCVHTYAHTSLCVHIYAHKPMCVWSLWLPHSIVCAVPAG